MHLNSNQTEQGSQAQTWLSFTVSQNGQEGRKPAGEGKLHPEENAKV